MKKYYYLATLIIFSIATQGCIYLDLGESHW